MLYEEARVYLDHVSKYGSVLGLDSIKSLMSELENPQNDLKFIHLAGTNGKGSILAMTAKILQEAGYKTGCYISPSVLGYLERFQIDGNWMAEDELAYFTFQVKEAVDRMTRRGLPSPTVFEIETAIAFLLFKKHGCDYVVLECGMGGAQDATNLIETSVVNVFASISMDHIGVLGNTLEEIAAEKSGIIKRGARVVTGWQKESVEKILREKAERMGCEIIPVRKDTLVPIGSSLQGQEFSYGPYEKLQLSLLGKHQLENASTVLAVCEALQKCGAQIPEEAIRRGLLKVSWPGRFQLMQMHPPVILDGAHNIDAARRLKENVETYLSDVPLYGVMGVFKDKEYLEMIHLLGPCFRKVYTIDLPNKERRLEKEALAKCWQDAGVSSEAVGDLGEAIRMAGQEAEMNQGAVLVFGSLSYLGDAMQILDKDQKGRS